MRKCFEEINLQKKLASGLLEHIYVFIFFLWKNRSAVSFKKKRIYFAMQDALTFLIINFFSRWRPLVHYTHFRKCRLKEAAYP